MPKNLEAGSEKMQNKLSEILDRLDTGQELTDYSILNQDTNLIKEEGELDD